MTDKLDSKALVVLSGGQDSITCLGVAMATHVEVEAITFYYGQRHSVEMKCAEEICEMYSIKHKLVNLSFLGELVTSNLTGDGDVNDPHEYKKDLPSSFVPNRNALFLVTAHAHAQEIGASVIYAGMCETDYSGYPDCRNEFIYRLEETLDVGYETSIKIKTPLMFLNKAETFKLAADHDFLEHVIEGSHTCYLGDRSNRFEWGYGCGTCPACELRKKGFEEYKEQFIADKAGEQNG